MLIKLFLRCLQLGSILLWPLYTNWAQASINGWSVNGSIPCILGNSSPVTSTRDHQARILTGTKKRILIIIWQHPVSLNYSLHQWTFLFTLSHLFEGQSFQITILIHTVPSRTDSGTTPRVLRTQGPSEWLSKYVSTVHLIIIIMLSSFSDIHILDTWLMRPWGIKSVWGWL